MQELFGIPMDTLMIILLIIFGLGTVVTAIVAARNPVLFKTAVRNIPRRRTQTALIILGLMLATLLISAALTTGDTISHSIRLGAINGQGLVDVTVGSTEEEAGGRPTYFDSSQIELVRDALAGDNQVAGIAPLARETAAVRAPETSLSEPRVTVLGIEQTAMTNFDPILDSSGATYSVTDLADDVLYISQRLANALDVLPLHMKYWGSEEAMEEGNPVGILERGEPVTLPPVLYVQGEKDMMHPRPHLDRFVAAYRKRGGEVDLALYPDEVEGFVVRNASGPNAPKAMERIIAFVHRHLS
jgi:pimeloyl-ACP methyl ester carboxylesterase